jgi:uncharacterized protein
VPALACNELSAEEAMTTVMFQGWHEISFLHWSCDPAVLQERTHQRLLPDTLDGKAWISLTPFLLRALRPLLIPKSLGLTFPEMNLRTYVVGPRGPGIWFFSLDASSLLAVLGARATYGLPYYWSQMRVEGGKDTLSYQCSRKGSVVSSRIEIRKGNPIVRPSRLDMFLTARYRLYSSWAGRLLMAEVEHEPWRLQEIQVTRLEENIRQEMAVEFPHDAFAAHYSPGVETKIGMPKPV